MELDTDVTPPPQHDGHDELPSMETTHEKGITEPEDGRHNIATTLRKKSSSISETHDAMVKEGTDGGEDSSFKSLAARLESMQGNDALMRDLFTGPRKPPSLDTESSADDISRSGSSVSHSESDLRSESEDESSDSSRSSDRHVKRHKRKYKSYFNDMIWHMAKSREHYMLAERRKRNRRNTTRRKSRKSKATQSDRSSGTDEVQSFSFSPEPGPAPGPASVKPEDISRDAYLRSETAEVVWVDWADYISKKPAWDKSIMTPIYAVNSEPDEREILQLRSIEMDSQVTHVMNRPESKPIDTPGTSAGPWSPERIKIISRPLNHILHKSNLEGNEGVMVFIRPFKEIVLMEKSLRITLHWLEEECRRVLKISEPPHPSEPEMLSVEKDLLWTSLLHLRCLMKFFDEYIKPRQEYLQSETCFKVCLYDLWHIFRPGDFVIDQNENQAYRVINVVHPRHKISSYFERDTMPIVAALQPAPFPIPPPMPPTTSRRKESAKPIEIINVLPLDPPPSYTMVQVPPGMTNSISILCAHIDFDGSKFGPISSTFNIPVYGGPKDIRSFPIYPLRFAQNINHWDQLVKRGKMLLDVSRFKSMWYSGHDLDSREEIESQVVVDTSEALISSGREHWAPEIGPLRVLQENVKQTNWCSAQCCHLQMIYKDEHIDFELTQAFRNGLIPERALDLAPILLTPRQLEDAQLGSDNQPTEEELVIMTHRVFGFVMRSRKWAQLDLTHLRYENSLAREFTRSSFDQLELPEGHRKMIKSLVTQHFRDRRSTNLNQAQTDIVRGKGKGLILLLHGAPGVGKTTTAEGVAELFEKPLFQITCGDLGSTAREVEVELGKNFALASRWGCILLLDEADVFLSARERKDFERNGLVAVFLRVLEYYTGILFLTTNRIGDFDEAFRSRIHMTLYYPELDEAKTKRVFALNLGLIQQRFDRQKRKITFDASSIEKFAVDHFKAHKYNRWNGRQIRNLCHTALALAEYDAHEEQIDGEIDESVQVQLQLKYFELVQKAYLEFGQYMGALRGNEGDQRAYDNAWRAKTGTPYETTPSRFSRGFNESQRENRYNQEDSFQPLVNQNFSSASPVPLYRQPNNAQFSMGQPQQTMGYGNQSGFQQMVPQVPATQVQMPQQPIPQQVQQMGYQQPQLNPGVQTMQQGQQVPQMPFNSTIQNFGNAGVQMQYAQTGQLPLQPVPGQVFQGQNLQIPQQPFLQPTMQGNVAVDTAGGVGSSAQSNQTAGSSVGGGP